MKTSEIKSLVEKSLLRCENTMDILERDPNPQIREVYYEQKGVHEALQAVLFALQNDPVLLKILAET
uniref:Uncharacterized protein n=1 Tax=viral metagenome TaxID=1070528 RepID=A0A6H2A5K9_9ZZZZ